MAVVTEKLVREDWDAVRTIYREGIVSGHATFEEHAPTWEVWDNSHLSICRLVAREKDTVVGWAALNPVSERCVYEGVAETSAYVSAVAQGRGIGRALLLALIEGSEAEGIWTLQAGIFPENAASLAVHRACGFREVGRRERIGKMGTVWRDTVLLERRSTVVGV